MMSHALRTILLAGILLTAAHSANASTGVTVVDLLLALLAVGGAFWLAFATITPFRQAMLRIPRDANRLGLLLMAGVAFAYAAGSVVLGKTSMGGGVVLQAVEPRIFWLMVKFQFGAGCVLLVLALLSPKRSG